MDIECTASCLSFSQQMMCNIYNSTLARTTEYTLERVFISELASCARLHSVVVVVVVLSVGKCCNVLSRVSVASTHSHLVGGHSSAYSHNGNNNNNNNIYNLICQVLESIVANFCCSLAGKKERQPICAQSDFVLRHVLAEEFFLAISGKSGERGTL